MSAIIMSTDGIGSTPEAATIRNRCVTAENRLCFKAGIKRVTNCMRSNGITSNVRRKKRNRIKRREEYINDNHNNAMDNEFLGIKRREEYINDNLLKGRFDRKRAYASKNGLTAEQFRNQAVSC